MSNLTVDVQKITEEIKEDLASKGVKNDIPSFDELFSYGSTAFPRVNSAALARELEYLKRNEIHYYRDITSFHRSIAPVVIFVKRVIRKLCKFLGEPMVDEINEYHRHVVRALETAVRDLGNLASGSPQPGYETDLRDEHKYKLLAEQYATANYHMTEQLRSLSEKCARLQEQCEQLRLKSERLELKVDIAGLREERTKLTGKQVEHEGTSGN